VSDSAASGGELGALGKVLKGEKLVERWPVGMRMQKPGRREQ